LVVDGGSPRRRLPATVLRAAATYAKITNLGSNGAVHLRIPSLREEK
jgi:hypothetical protein